MKKKKINAYLNLLVKLAMSMVVSVFVCFGISVVIEERYSFHGVVIIFGTFVGVIVGFYCMYLQLKDFF